MSNFSFIVPKLRDAGAWLDWRGKYEGGYGWRGSRDVAKANFVVAHHSVTNPTGNAEVDVNTVANIHLNGNGWGGIGYHFIITSEEVNGYAKVAYVGDLASVRAHTPNTRGAFNLAAGYGNNYLIAACFVGQNHLNVPTPAQIRSANALFGEMLFNEKHRMPTLSGGWDDLKAHYDFDWTKCNGLPQIIKMIRDYKDPKPKKEEKKPTFVVRSLGEPHTFFTKVGTRVRDLVTGKTTRQYSRVEPFQATHALEHNGEKYYMTQWSYVQFDGGKNPTAVKEKDLSVEEEKPKAETKPVETIPVVVPPAKVLPGKEKPQEGEQGEPVEEPTDKPIDSDAPTKEPALSNKKNPSPKKPSIEASKLVGRKGILAAISAIIVGAGNWGVSQLMGLDIPSDIAVPLGGLVFAMLAWVDKYLHERGKLVETRIKGLIGF